MRFVFDIGFGRSGGAKGGWQGPWPPRLSFVIPLYTLFVKHYPINKPNELSPFHLMVNKIYIILTLEV